MRFPLAHGNRRAGRAELVRVVEQVPNRAVDGGGARTHRCRVTDVERDLAAGAAARPFDDLFDEAAEVDVVHRFFVAGIGREVDEFGDEFGQLAQLGFDFVEQFGALDVVHLRSRALQHFDVGAQRGERRSQLVTRVHHEPVLLLARSSGARAASC